MQRVLVVALAGVLAGLLLTMQAGCSCSSDPASKTDLYRRATPEELEAIRKATAEKAAKEEREAAQKRAEAEAAKRREEEERRQRAEAQRLKREQQQLEWQAKAQEERQKNTEPPKPQFPEDPADWTKDDFPKAREAGEPRLIDAVNHLGEMFPTSEPAVPALVSLLRPAGPAADQKLIEAIVHALAKNKTAQATQALRDLVNGKLETELPSIARSRAMRALAERDASLFDELLLAALRSADDDRRHVHGAFDWEAELLELIENRASPSLRVRVANYAMEPGTSSRQRDKLLQLLTRPAPANLSAQLVLLSGAATDVTLKPVLARQLAMVSSCVLQRLLGMPASVTPSLAVGSGTSSIGGGGHGITSFGGPASPARAQGGATSVFDDPNLLHYGPPALWSDSSVTMVSESLFQLERLNQAPHYLQLAVTIPVKRTRHELLETLHRNWHDGPDGLRTAGIPQKIVFDPALPVLLRCLPHTTPGMADWRRHLFSAGRSGTAGESRQRLPGQWSPVHQQKQYEALVEYAWAQLLGETTSTLCSRFQAAAEATISVYGVEATIETAANYTPIPLHENARVVGFHQASLPGAAGGSSHDGFTVDPTKVTYIRVVDNVPFRKTFLHYARQISEPAVFADQRTAWLGGLERNDPEGTVRSIDIFITRTGAFLLDLPDADERMIIQVLCVECADPRVAVEDASSAAIVSEAQ